MFSPFFLTFLRMSIRKFTVLLFFVAFTIQMSDAAKIAVSFAKKGWIFPFQDKFWLLYSDSIYQTSDGKNWVGEKHSMELDNIDSFSIIETDSLAYIFHGSGGRVIYFDGKKFTEPRRSMYQLRTQYGSYSFIKDGEPHLFGGYGIFEWRNDLIFYDKNKTEWELIIPKTPLKNLPPRRCNPIGQYLNEDLYIAGGDGIDEEVEYSYNNDHKFRGVWKFTFSTKEWSKIGELNPDIQLSDYIIIKNFKGTNLLINQKGFSEQKLNVYQIDLQENKVIEYKNSDFNALVDLCKTNCNSIVYNNQTKKFLLLIGKENGTCEPVVYDEDILLGTEKVEYSAYSFFNYYIILIIALFLVAFAAYAIYIVRTKSVPDHRTIIEKININLHKFQEALTEDEFKILNFILNSYPSPVSFPDLILVLNANSGYEAQIKKLRQIFININETGRKLLKIKIDILVQEKNPNDKRIKQIYVHNGN